jgi:heparin/heparan-sulfate lyase
MRFNPDTYDLFFMRSGWDPGATVVSFHAGDWFGSHDHLDVGHFSIFRRQWLALDAGVYTPMGGSHYVNFSHRSLAHNTLLIRDPEEQFQVPHNRGVEVINDGGQREVVSLGGRSTQNNSDLSIWRKNRLGGAHFERSTVLHWFSGDTLDFVSADITMAYNSDFFSSYGANFRNSSKVRQVVRSLTYIRPSTVVVYDRVESTDPSFVKTWNLNTAHQPYLAGGGVFLAENGSSRLAGRTFLPAEPQREIWGSHSEPFRFLGVDMHHNYDLADYPGVEPGGWIIRISAPVGNTYDEFLHLLSAGDANLTSGDLLAGWDAIKGKGLRVLRNGELILAFLDGTELSPRVTLPEDSPRAVRVFLFGVPEGVTVQVLVSGKEDEKAKNENGVVEVEAGPEDTVELKIKG